MWRGCGKAEAGTCGLMAHSVTRSGCRGSRCATARMLLQTSYTARMLLAAAYTSTPIKASIH